MEQHVLYLRKSPLPGGIRPIQGENCSGSRNQDMSEILKRLSKGRLLLSPDCSNAWPLTWPWTDGVDNWPAQGAQRLFLAGYKRAATPSASWPCTPPPRHLLRRPHLLHQEERRGSFWACNAWIVRRLAFKGCLSSSWINLWGWRSLASTQSLAFR